MSLTELYSQAVKRRFGIISALLVVYYMCRFLYHTIRTRSYWFLRYYPGHFGSTIPDAREIRRQAQQVFDGDSRPCLGIDLQEKRQLDLLKSLSKHFPDFPFPALPDSGFRYYYRNPMYGLGDGLILYACLRHYRPRQAVEIGSGFSSALMLDTVDRHPEVQTRFTFIEPFPRRLNHLLRSQDPRHCRIIQKNVQKVDPSIFRALNANDILFIDSSHVVKIGSDVSHILFDVLPALNQGVLVHFHDIWWPFEYPRGMILEGRIWNEPYFVRSFLQFNRAFEIIYFASYIEKMHREAFLKHTPGDLISAGAKSLWLRKKG